MNESKDTNLPIFSHSKPQVEKYFHTKQRSVQNRPLISIIQQSLILKKIFHVIYVQYMKGKIEEFSRILHTKDVEISSLNYSAIKRWGFFPKLANHNFLLKFLWKLFGNSHEKFKTLQ
jgi:hypothetical protein